MGRSGWKIRRSRFEKFGGERESEQDYIGEESDIDLRAEARVQRKENERCKMRESRGCLLREVRTSKVNAKGTGADGDKSHRFCRHNAAKPQVNDSH